MSKEIIDALAAGGGGYKTVVGPGSQSIKGTSQQLPVIPGLSGDMGLRALIASLLNAPSGAIGTGGAGMMYAGNKAKQGAALLDALNESPETRAAELNNQILAEQLLAAKKANRPVQKKFGVLLDGHPGSRMSRTNETSSGGLPLRNPDPSDSAGWYRASPEEKQQAVGLGISVTELRERANQAAQAELQTTQNTANIGSSKGAILQQLMEILPGLFEGLSNSGGGGNKERPEFSFTRERTPIKRN